MVPPASAAALRLAVPVEELPPCTVDGLRVSDRGGGGGGAVGVRVRAAVTVTPAPVAEIVTVVWVLTWLVAMLKSALTPSKPKVM